MANLNVYRFISRNSKWFYDLFFANETSFKRAISVARKNGIIVDDCGERLESSKVDMTVFLKSNRCGWDVVRVVR